MTRIQNQPMNADGSGAGRPPGRPAVSGVGYALFLWAMAANAYLAVGVRIQTEGAYRVAMGGPYGTIRHPGYAGTILAQLATPVLLGSLWASLPSLGSAVCYVPRTVLEDKMLMEELPGCPEYARQTGYRLVRRLW
jgi:protein-S-isoprenylcysteine O-methyltransferase Ste14